MSRPACSVVMPFSGDAAAGRTAADALLALQVGEGDELILVDNSGVLSDEPGLTLVRAERERSPAFARNAGAARATRDWILFLDSDTRPPPGLLDAYFAAPIDPSVGALAGEVLPAPGAQTFAERYGATRSFLSQRAHLEHPFRPRAAAANLLVRREAFVAVGGFYEGVRAGEDTDFTWRLQQAGWRLALASQAAVEHRYRTSLGDLRRQWRGYAAGRAWLARRYSGFRPRPALTRALARAGRRPARRKGADRPADGLAPADLGSRAERAGYLAIDAVLGVEELAGMLLSNRPRGDPRTGARRAGTDVVLVAERFPARGDPLAELASRIENARVQAVARPDTPDVEVSRTLAIDYLEDDGLAARALATIVLVARHPLRCAADTMHRDRGAPPLRRLAPAALRVSRARAVRVQPLGGAGAAALAARLAALAGRGLER